MPPLDHEYVQKYAAQVPDWKVSDDEKKISREFTFRDFVEAMKFVNAVADIAQSEGHHPDISFGWGYAEFLLWTHAIGGLHENDFIVASKINGLNV